MRCLMVLVLIIVFLGNTSTSARAQMDVHGPGTPVDSGSAQDPPSTSTPDPPGSPGCALHPAPGCRYFGVTELGVAFGSARKMKFDSDFGTAQPGRELFIEGGVMRNIDSHDAVGVTWFLALDNNAGSTGPAARYRRWLTNQQSLDVGAGIALTSSDYDAGTLFGVIRYSPNQLLGLTVRPERIRHTKLGCVAGRCAEESDNHFRLLVGGDLGGKAGVVVMSWYGVAAGVAIVAVLLAGGP
jgi:hypothetical protein